MSRHQSTISFKTVRLYFGTLKVVFLCCWYWSRGHQSPVFVKIPSFRGRSTLCYIAVIAQSEEIWEIGQSLWCHDHFSIFVGLSFIPSIECSIRVHGEKEWFECALNVFFGRDRVPWKIGVATNYLSIFLFYYC